jgi:hypothetical protein
MPKPYNDKSRLSLQGKQPQRSPEQRAHRNRVRKDQPRRGPDQPLAPHAVVIVEHVPRKLRKVFPRQEVLAAIRASGGAIGLDRLRAMLRGIEI